MAAVILVWLITLVVFVPAALVRRRRFGDSIVPESTAAGWTQTEPTPREPTSTESPDRGGARRRLRDRGLPAWVPSGRSTLVGVVGGGVAIYALGLATTVPADPRFFPLAAAGGVGVGVALVLAVRDRRFGVHPAGTATTAAAWLFGLWVPGLVGPTTVWAAPLTVLAVLVSLPLTVFLVVGTIGSLARDRRDVAVAVGLVVAVVASVPLAQLEPRLRGPAGRDLAAEAAALSERAVPEVDDVTAAGAGPHVLADTERRVVVWRIPRWDPAIPVLVHDPDGWIDQDGRVGLLDHCEHVTGPWWRCSAG